ncbi:DUF7341 domain-containing protein [Nocardia xishanensis]|uniref:DUF7341 domain-containing protein n=1 Tax=Nocardia xishanensis TaxID=238964 RepID=UPI00082B8BEC|nr:hypothetical protein [Nocardia xishanensis]
MSEATPELVAGAHTAFVDAVHALIGLRPDTITRDDGTTTIVLDSLYAELLEARHGEQRSDPTAGTVYKSRPPLWIDAASLLHQIDRTVAGWWRHLPADDHGLPATVRRLHALVDHDWRPQDVGELRRMTRTVEDWVQRVKTLLPEEVTHTWELRAACPACGETTLHVDDGSGELVRRAVLQANQSGAHCLACTTTWAPEYFAILARTIGAGLPEGVLE